MHAYFDPVTEIQEICLEDIRTRIALEQAGKSGTLRGLSVLGDGTFWISAIKEEKRWYRKDSTSD